MSYAGKGKIGIIAGLFYIIGNFIIEEVLKAKLNRLSSLFVVNEEYQTNNTENIIKDIIGIYKTVDILMIIKTLLFWFIITVLIIGLIFIYLSYKELLVGYSQSKYIVKIFISLFIVILSAIISVDFIGSTLFVVLIWIDYLLVYEAVPNRYCIRMNE